MLLLERRFVRHRELISCPFLRRKSSAGCTAILRPAFERFGEADLKRGRDQFNVLQADVAFAALDTADVAAVEAHPECEIFLAPPAIFSKLAHTIAEEGFDVVVRHGDGIVVLDDKASTDLASGSRVFREPDAK